MACKELQRLSEAYLDAFKRQQWITQRLAELRQSGNGPIIEVAEAQEETAIDEVYDAWHALNRHSCSDECPTDDQNHAARLRNGRDCHVAIAHVGAGGNGLSGERGADIRPAAAKGTRAAAATR